MSRPVTFYSTVLNIWSLWDYLFIAKKQKPFTIKHHFDQRVSPQSCWEPDLCVTSPQWLPFEITQLFCVIQPLLRVAQEKILYRSLRFFKFQEWENNVNDSSGFFCWVMLCRSCIFYLVVCVWTCGHKPPVVESRAPDGTAGGNVGLPHLPILIGYRLLPQGRVVFQRARPHFQECLDSISICGGILCSSP